MGSVVVDQIGPRGELIEAADTTLSNTQKNELLLAALPGARIETYAGERVIRFGNQILLKKQVTHLGIPWPGFKKRIQIPKQWLEVERKASADGLVTRFVGIYHFDPVTIFVDFDPTTYVRRKANNSAAHVATNDLYQAQVLGQFSRIDRNGNRLTSVRGDEFARYVREGYVTSHPSLDVFRSFNAEFLDARRPEALGAIKAMHAASWPDTFQGEWPGFYLEFRLDAFLRARSLTRLIEYQKVKGKEMFDFDLVFKEGQRVSYYGDLKASDVVKHESPGNDADDIYRCVSQFGRFWYVIYEHETTHARNNGDLATIAWNEWKRSVGYQARKGYNPRSYAQRFKESVRFVKMSILEVNPANFHVVLGDFRQGRQQGGAARALKVMIKKSNIDNFLIYSESVGVDNQCVR